MKHNRDTRAQAENSSTEHKPLTPTPTGPDPSDTSDMVKRHPAPEASPPRVPSNYRTFTL